METARPGSGVPGLRGMGEARHARGRDFGVRLGGALCMVALAAAQTPVGALAIDESQGDQYGWAVDYETTAAAREAALRECGSGCSVVLTFGRRGSYAADQDADSTAVGWAESYDSAEGARAAALAACRSRGGSGCVVRVTNWPASGSWIWHGDGLSRTRCGPTSDRATSTA